MDVTDASIHKQIAKLVETVVEGRSEHQFKVKKIIINCLSNKIYGGTKMINELQTANLDYELTCRLTRKVEQVLENTKRKDILDENSTETKRRKFTDSAEDDSSATLNIQKIMANAQKQIEDRKRQLGQPIINFGNGGLDSDKAKRIAALQEQIRAKLSGNASVLNQSVISRPTPLILNAEGRTIDQTGKEVNVPQPVPTLKANIRAKKKEATKFLANSGTFEDTPTNNFHDDRIIVKPPVRNKRILKFHEPGKFQIMGERLRMKAQLDKLQNEISQIARKTGISSATKLALIAPKTDFHLEDVPAMEWWDSVVLVNDLDTYTDGKIAIRTSAITNLIEHPQQIRPPNEAVRPAYLPVYLTQKERKKLRRQNRREAWKEEQEKIRLGLIEPPEPKLRISNLMRVLGTEAVQDPTKIEAHVREQMAKRQKLHEDTNNARKLTAEQKREKKIRKMKEDVSLGVAVTVYRVKFLSASKKYKVETNAKQYLMTGVVVLFRDCCIVVVEGGLKQQRKYKRLMMHRIKWEEDIVKDIDGKEVPNSCVLVWEGISPKRNFGEVKFKTATNEKTARELFQKHHVEQFWDLAYSGAVLEASEEI